MANKKDYGTQQGSYYKEISVEEAIRRFGRTDLLPIKIEKSQTMNLKTNLVVPSKYQCYSLAIEYMSNWFYKRFPDKFFKHKYLDASHIMDQFRKLSTRELIVINKPAAHITVDEDQEYNRNGIDIHNMGATLYTNRARWNDAFFIDRELNTYISMVMRQVKLNFTFTVRVNTKHIQDDVAEIADVVFRANGTQKHFEDMDFPVPKELIGQIATDKGMCNGEGYYDVKAMLKYLNQHSKFTFTYKFNPATGQMEYYIRMIRQVVHIRTSSVLKDQAVYKSMSATDFSVRFNTEVLFPSIKFFAYYSMVSREVIHSITQLDTKSFLFGVTNLANIPPVDENGWNWEFRTSYTLEDPVELKQFEKKEPVVVKLEEAFKGELLEVINYTKEIALSPSRFINIKAFNWVSYIPLEINWETLEVKFLEPLKSKEIYFVFYIDKEYMHDSIRILKKIDTERIRPFGDHMKGDIELGTKLPKI